MLLNAFFKHRGGNFATLSAIVLPLMLFGVGASVDYGLAVHANQKLKAAAEAAVLGAVSEAQQAFISQENVDLNELIKSTAKALFEANVGSIAQTDVTALRVVPMVNKNEISARIDYDATYTTSLVKALGYKEIQISNNARSVVNVRSFINISFLMDVSASMGIGATAADQQILANTINCAFACHIDEARGNSKYDKARAAGADMRIDVARDAAMAAVDASEETEEYDDQVSFGIYKFSNELTTVMSHKDARASDGSYVKSQLQNGIQMDMTNGGTNIENALKTLSNTLPKSGMGLRADDRIQYVVVLTDGVESGQAWTKARDWFLHSATKTNTPYKTHAGHEVNYALNTSACDKLKTKDVETYIIYTEYMKPAYGAFSQHDKDRFAFVTNSLFPIIPTRFTACTGDAEHVIHADTPEEIKTKFTDIVRSLSAPLRLY